MRDLNACMFTIKHGYIGNLYVQIFSKPCTVYEDSIFIGMGYLKNSIKFIGKYKLPTYPSSTKIFLGANLCYCIRTYDPDEYKKQRLSISKNMKKMQLRLL